MATTVLNFIGDDIPYAMKEVHSMKIGASFESERSRLKPKLQLGDLAGVVLYHTEGTRPHLRPTRPLSWKSTPGKEKLKRGAVLWCREATRLRQEQDVQFQESLEEWRAARGYDGPQPELADVDEFIEELSTSLAAVAAKDISEREDTARRKILAEEFREFRDFTVDERARQQLRDAEEAGRAAVASDLQMLLNAGYQTHVAVPRYRPLLRAEEAACDAAQKKLEDEESNERRDTERQASMSRQAASLADANRKAAADAEKRAEELELMKAQAREAAALQQQQLSSGGGGGGSLSDAQMKALVDSLQGGGAASPEVMVALRALQERLDAQDEKSEGLVRTLVAAHNDALERKFASIRRDEGDMAQRYQARLQQFEKEAVRAGIAGAETAADADAIERLVQEQNALLQEMRDLEEAEAEQCRQALQQAQGGAMAAVAGSLLAAQSHIAATLERIEASRLRVEAAIVAREKREAAAADQRATASNDDAAVASPAADPGEPNEECAPEPESIGWLPRAGPPVATRQVLADAALRFGLAEQCGYGAGAVPARLFVEDMLSQYSSPWAVADAIEAYSPRAQDPVRLESTRRIRRCCDEHAPHLGCVAGLLADLHKGKDAELCAAIIRGATGHFL
jgi:hypothetical protein